MSKKRKTWPVECVWPAPINPEDGMQYEWDYISYEDVMRDPYLQEMELIHDYYERLVEEGILNLDYSLNKDYEPDEDFTSDEDFDPDNDETFDIAAWEPAMGIDYWDEDHFEESWWQDDLSVHMNALKLDECESKKSHLENPAYLISKAIGYEFLNENLARQAFTRKAFALEYGIYSAARTIGCSEELEFFGDTVINTIIMKEMVKLYTFTDETVTVAPFGAMYGEGDMSRLRSKFVCKEHLAARAKELGFEKYILYGTGEAYSESACEDAMEALIGAVAVDSGWDWTILENVVDLILNLQLECPDKFLKASYYELLNSWHQKHFQRVPEYEVFAKNISEGERTYNSTLRFCAPENAKEIRTSQLVTGSGATRSEAREDAARKAVCFLQDKGLWINLADSHIVPKEEDSINQLQELYQKKYLNSTPVYEFEETPMGDWICDCRCSGMWTFGRGGSKTKAKKAAAYKMLEKMLG